MVNPKSKYQKELEKVCKKFPTSNECYASNEYKKAYPKLIKLYKKEGLDLKRRNLLRNRRRLKEMGMDSLFAVR